MWTNTLMCFLACSVGCSLTDKLISKGKWIVEKIGRCPDEDKYEYKFDITKKKLNRKEDGFDLVLDFPEAVTGDNMGVRIEVCKKVDGGCKLVQIMEDTSVCAFLMKHAAGNFKKILKLAGLEQDCPIPKGQYKVVDFELDHNEMPEEGMVGRFEALAFMTKQQKKVCCANVHAYLDTSDNDDK